MAANDGVAGVTTSAIASNVVARIGWLHTPDLLSKSKALGALLWDRIVDHVPGDLGVEARRMLKALVRRKKLPQSEVIEALIREEYGKG